MDGGRFAGDSGEAGSDASGASRGLNDLDFHMDVVDSIRDLMGGNWNGDRTYSITGSHR